MIPNNYQTTNPEVKIINFQMLTISDIVLLACIILVFFIQIYYSLRYYLKLALHKDDTSNMGSNPVTVILPVRNEEDGIREILAKFTDQRADDYELLVINDNSEDNTVEILNVLAKTNPKLKITSLTQETRFSEKQALNIGLKGASSEWIILLTPLSGKINPEWLAGLSGLAGSQTDAVIAYTNVVRIKGFRNLKCHLERFNQFMISGAWTLAGKPFVFNENNILFKKSMYFNTLGFRHKLNRNFANLELIFNENFKKGRVKITTNPELAVNEHIEDNKGDHIRLLKKGVQIRQSLSLSKRFSLFLNDFTQILLSGLTIVIIIIHPEYWITILALPVIYLSLLAIIVKMLLTRFKERKIYLPLLTYILIKPIINWWFFWSIYLIHRRSRWN